MCKVLISGGGTGGHIFPAIAIAKELVKQRPDVEVEFVGARGKMEMQKVPEAGFAIDGLWISGFHRKSSLKNLLLPFKVIHSLYSCWRIIRRFKPDFVVGVGGYASGPLLYMANLFNIPSAIQEQNGYPGITNKLLAKNADIIFVAFSNMEKYFPLDKMLLLGNPVRDVFIKDVNLNLAYKHFNLDEAKKTVLVFGGSLGAFTLNNGMFHLYDQIARSNDIQWIWQIGSHYFDEYSTCKTAELSNVHPTMFIDKMELAYACADIVICRAGALTLAELSICGKASILVPSPNVSEDHQTKNALALVEKEAALICKDEKFMSDIFPLAMDLLENDDHRKSLENNISELAKPYATRDIVNKLLQLL